MGLSIWHLLVVLVIVLVVFGPGKLSRGMGEIGSGIRNFKKGLNDKDDEAQKRLPDDHTPPAA